jgi:hypothetical protein
VAGVEFVCRNFASRAGAPILRILAILASSSSTLPNPTGLQGGHVAGHRCRRGT